MQEVKDLCSALENNTRLNDFTATSHSLSVEDAEQFAGVLRSNSTLQSLSLGTSSFGNEALSALSGGLSGVPGSSPMVQHVNDLPACMCSLHAMPVMAHDEWLQPGNTGLQKLDLHSKGVGAPGLRALQQAIAAGTGLDHLTLSGNSLGDEGAAAVAAAIPFIREVTVPSSLIEFDGHALLSA